MFKYSDREWTLLSFNGDSLSLLFHFSFFYLTKPFKLINKYMDSYQFRHLKSEKSLFSSIIDENSLNFIN